MFSLIYTSPFGSIIPLSPRNIKLVTLQAAGNVPSYYSKRETAKILNIFRNTVKKQLELKEKPIYNRTIYKSCLDEYKELIIEWRCEPYEFNGTRIFKELKKKGYSGSIGPVYRFL